MNLESTVGMVKTFVGFCKLFLKMSDPKMPIKRKENNSFLLKTKSPE